MKNVKIFASTVEEEALKQIEKLADYKDYADCKIRIMPDVHAGRGCTIGTTIVLNDTVSPNLVGVDVGCGVLCIDMGIEYDDIDLNELDNIIRSFVPSGQKVHDNANYINYVQHIEYMLKTLKYKLSQEELDYTLRSIGTLGGEGHFIEVGIDTHQNCFLFVHTGSRKLGVTISKYYQDIAKKENEKSVKNYSQIIKTLKESGQSHLIESTLNTEKEIYVYNKENEDLCGLTGVNFENYMNDMNICTDYAEINRISIAKTIFEKMNLFSDKKLHFDTKHNYIENANGTYILRNGAVRANKDELFVVPFNMRDGILICKGKGNDDWNNSAPHGAGRLLSRTKAKEQIKLEDYQKSMFGVFSTCVKQNTIDESPFAYKDMNEIICLVSETAEILYLVSPIYNFKANS